MSCGQRKVCAKTNVPQLCDCELTAQLQMEYLGPFRFLEFLIETTVLSVGHTCKNGPSFTLLFHASLLFARYCERRLEYKAPDVMALLKVGLPVLQLLVV